MTIIHFFIIKINNFKNIIESFGKSTTVRLNLNTQK